MGSLFRVSAGATANWTWNYTTSRDQEYYHKLYPFMYVPLLETYMNRLKARKKDLENHTILEQRTKEMTKWMEDVVKADNEVNTLLIDKERKNFGAHVDAQLKKVKDLNEQRDKWDQLVPIVKKPATMDMEYPTPPKIVGLQSKLDEMLRLITTETEAGPIIAINGACGIGKTTLLREIGKKFRPKDEKAIALFTTVIFICVTKKVDYDSIQEEIAENLNLLDDREKNFMELKIKERASILSAALSRETFLIMLDDLWETLDFQKIGIPDECKPRSRIIISTRLKRVAMCTAIKLDMKYLNESDSTELFALFCAHEKRRSGDIAEKIVNKCAGLPLALTVLGKGIAARYPPYIYECLSLSPQDINGMEENLLRKLKDSFDALDNTIKPCFLFCVLLQDFKDISRKQLAEYWIGEELECNGNLEKARDFIEQLLGFCMLEAPDADNVTIHSIVRSMAVWLAKDSPDEGHRFQFYAREKFDKGAYEKMDQLKRASLVDAEIDINEVLKCSPVYPCLETFLMGLSRNRPQDVTHMENDCFKSNKSVAHKILPQSSSRMPSIRVLDLAYRHIQNLPGSVSYLKSLKYLNLSYTLIRRLPDELGALTSLILLDLRGTGKLVKIPCKDKTSFSKLKWLKLYDSAYRKFGQKGQLGFQQLMAMSYLEELQFSPQDLETLRNLSNYRKLSHATTYLHLPFFSQTITELSEILPKFVNLKVLSIKASPLQTVEQPMQPVSKNMNASCTLIDKESIIDLEKVPKLDIIFLQDQSDLVKLSIIPPLKKETSHMLHKLQISLCSKLKSITCLDQLQNLEILEIRACGEIVELLSLPSETSSCRREEHTECLANLKSLKLECLSKLKRISHSNLSSKSLEVITVSGCDNLNKLQVSPTNVGRKIKLYCEKPWWTKLEWNDGVTEASFDRCVV